MDETVKKLTDAMSSKGAERVHLAMAEIVLAALPSLVKPLRWDSGVAMLEDGCRYYTSTSWLGTSTTISFVSDGRVTTLGSFASAEEARELAEHHHTMRVMRLLGL